MFSQKLSEHSKEFEKQQKRIKQLKASGKSTKDAVRYHYYFILLTLYNTLYKYSYSIPFKYLRYVTYTHLYVVLLLFISII